MKQKPKFKAGDFVTYKGERVVITDVYKGKYHISNMNMPFCGSICEMVRFDEVKK
jgi:hypothetical protein